tara:strand:- start:188 stop:508 length:321 start_codon:yes stop_codon:yes gene_type:complete
MKDRKEYNVIECKIPKVGDVAFKNKDWREENPFDIIDVVKCEGKLITIINPISKENKGTYNIYNVFGFNKKEGFRKFRFSGGAFLDSIKVRAGSKKEKFLTEQFNN